MPLSKEQFSLLRSKGLSVDQIVAFEAGKVPATATPVAPKEPAAKKDIKTGVSGFGQSLGDAIAVSENYATPQEQMSGIKKNYVTEAQDSQAQSDIMRQKLVDAIVKNKKEGKDTSRLLNAYNITGGTNMTLEDLIPSANKTSKQIAGEGVSTLGAALMGSGGAASAVGRIGEGAVLGGVTGVGSSLEKNNNTAKIIKDGLGGAFTGAALAGFFEGAGAIARKIGGSKVVDNITGNNLNKELQPDTKELASQIKNEFQTFGQKARDVIGADGKPVYVGGYKTLMNKAKTEVEDNAKILAKKLKVYDKMGIKANQSEIVGDLITNLQDQYGTLSKSQLKTVEMYVKNHIGNNMSPTEMLNAKRTIDGLISKSDWSKIASGLDPQVSFASQVKYMLRDNLRKTINSKTGDKAIQTINNRMGIGMEMRDLAATQLAKRGKTKMTASGGLFGIIGKIADDTIFNPAITTRVSQATKNLGQNTGKGAVRKLTRNAIIRSASKSKSE